MDGFALKADVRLLEKKRTDILAKIDRVNGTLKLRGTDLAEVERQLRETNEALRIKRAEYATLVETIKKISSKAESHVGGRVEKATQIENVVSIKTKEEEKLLEDKRKKLAADTDAVRNREVSVEVREGNIKTREDASDKAERAVQEREAKADQKEKDLDERYRAFLENESMTQALYTEALAIKNKADTEYKQSLILIKESAEKVKKIIDNANTKEKELIARSVHQDARDKALHQRERIIRERERTLKMAFDELRSKK